MRSIATNELNQISGGDDWYKYPENPPPDPNKPLPAAGLGTVYTVPWGFVGTVVEVFGRIVKK